VLTSNDFVGMSVGRILMPNRDTNMRLTDVKCRKREGPNQAVQASDGGGLHLLVNADGLSTGAWRIDGMANNANALRCVYPAAGLGGTCRAR